MRASLTCGDTEARHRLRGLFSSLLGPPGTRDVLRDEQQAITDDDVEAAQSTLVIGSI